MTSPEERHALVLGGCGNVGSGVVSSFLSRGYRKVAVISRDPERLDRLRQMAGGDVATRLALVVGDVGTEEGCAVARDEVLRQCGGRIDDVVSCIGFPWWQKGPLKDQSRGEVESCLNSLVVAPFVAYKTFIRLVEDSHATSYTFVTGGGADMFLTPGTGMMSVAGAAAQGLARVALKEHAESPVTVTEISFLAGVTPVPDQMPPTFVWIHNRDAGEAITSVATRRSGRGRTATVQTLDHLKMLVENGVL